MKTFLTQTFLVCLSVLAPIHAILITVGILIFVDAITGIWAAIKRLEPISSAALRRTVSKFVIYQTAIITGFLLQKYILDDAIPVTKLVAGVIGLVEFKSVLENANIIMGVNLFKELLKQLGSKNDQR